MQIFSALISDSSTIIQLFFVYLYSETETLITNNRAAQLVKLCKNKMTVFSKLPELELKYKASTISEKKISSSVDLFDLMKDMFNADTVEYREEVIILFLNNANRPIGWMKHSAGGTVHTIIDTKMILVSALKAGAQCITIAHNHPSGQNFPSREDEKVTQKVKIGCEAVGIRFLDHLIIASVEEGIYYSFADEGKI